MKRVGFRILLLMFGLLGAFAVQALAQEATIVGTVTDPSGAAVPNAAITITNVDTARVTSIKTNEAGQYIAPELHIGSYTVHAEATGFKSADQTGVVLAVGDRTRIDFKLELGTTRQTVTVEATPVKVQTDTGEVSGVITGRQVTQLATNGRAVYTLAALVPGAVSNMSSFNVPVPVGGDASVSFNGLRQNHNLWLIDGGEDSDRGGAGGLDVMPSMDSIAEFRVLSSNYSPEYGLSSAGTMTLVLKSGTRQFHANAWEFLRNDAVDAADPFRKASGTPSPELRFNIYGFNVGGPVSYKGKNKDKTFFFYNMEWRKLVQGGSTNQQVPLTSEYGGVFPSSGDFATPIHVPDFSKLSAAQQLRFTNLGLTSKESFPSNTIPSSLLDPNAQVLLQAGIFPAPTAGGNHYIGGNKLPTDLREELVRIDEHFNDRFFMFGHYIAEQITQTYGTSLWSGDNVPTVGTSFGNPSYSAVIHAAYTISPTLLNEIAFNYDGNRINIVPVGTFTRPSGLTIPELFSSNNDNRIPRIQLSGDTGTNFDIASWPWHNGCDDYQIKDDISWVKGSHQLRFGASWAIYKKYQDLFGNTQGGFTFDGGYTGSDFADFLLGYAGGGYNELAVQDTGHWNAVSWAAYIMDNWRVNNRLTINLGLRWDGVPHTYEANGRMANFYPSLWNPANAAILTAGGSAISPSSPGLGTSPNPDLAGLQFYLNGIGIPGSNGIGKGLVENHWAAFGPRIGFAYDINGTGRTVIRGGFGVMYERMQGNDMYNAGPNQPWSASVTLPTDLLSDPSTSILTGLTLSAPITIGDITGLSNTNYKLPVSYQYSLGVQNQLSRDSVLSITYVGNQNRHQNYYRETNLPNPSDLPAIINKTLVYDTVVPYLGFNSLRMGENAENSYYNGLQIELKSRVKRDLTLNAAYTLSRSVDPGNGFGGDLNNVHNPYNVGYDSGPAFSDATHVATISVIYDIPLFRNATSRAARIGLGGWEISGIGAMQSGLPLNITLGGDQGSNGIPNATNLPDLTGTVSYPSNVKEWFNTSAFSTPAVGAWGNMGRNTVRGPGRDNWNISLFKNFVLSETRGSAIELRIESFNTFNHTQFRNVSTSFSAGDFGQVTSVWDPRVLQFGLKVKF
jgi:Carboxypeptidase regulatory-like domain